MTRLARMKEEGREAVFPPNTAPFITDWLFEIGPTVQGAAISWQDMAAWSRMTGVDLTPWECRTIRRLSKAYSFQQSEAQRPTCVEPRLEEDEATIADRVSDQFAALMGAFSAQTRQADDRTIR